MKYKAETRGVFSVRLYGKAHCARMITRAKGFDKWAAARVNVEGNGGSRYAVLPAARSALVLARVHAPDFCAVFEERVSAVVRPLVQTLWNVDLSHYEDTQLVRYSSGGHIITHKDSDDREFPGRYFTIICYLNDNFTGGETVFPSLGCTVTPVAGRALVFPSRYAHAALPVTKGEKIAFVAWLCGPVPIRWI